MGGEALGSRQDKSAADRLTDPAFTARDAGVAPFPRAGRARRKWKRAAPQERSQAGAALAESLKPPPRRVGALLILIVTACALHLAILPLFRLGQGGDLTKMAAEDNYLRKVIQKERAKVVSKNLARRITMPPPPAEPEAVVSTTLNQEIATDLAKTVGDLLDVNVRSKLTSKVAANMRDELAAAARDIAEGKLSEEEIRKLQEDFKRKAHQQTVAALKEHREETQVEHAKLTVTDWYEKRVAATLINRIQHELFRAYSKAFYLWGAGGWTFLHGDHFERKVNDLGSLAQGRHYDPRGDIGGQPLEHGARMLPDWPGCSLKQAEAIERVARGLFERHPQGWAPSWDDAFANYLEAYHPHLAEQVREASGKPLAASWEKLWKQIDEYKAKVAAANSSDPGNVPAELKASQAACMETLKALHEQGRKVLVPPERAGDAARVNQAVRSRVLRGQQRDRAYERFVDEMVRAFSPAVRGLAENSFKEGILIRQKGQDDISKEFVEAVVQMLRRDVQVALPKPKFDDEIFHEQGNPYVSKVTKENGPPSPEDIEADEEALKKALERWKDGGQAYADKRAELIARGMSPAVDRIVEELLGRLTENGQLRPDFYRVIETVDYTDPVQLRLEARRQAMDGRGQDLARLTDDGLPDTSAPLVALMLGASKGHGASLQPVEAALFPGHVAGGRPESALRASLPQPAPYPARWGRVTQPDVQPAFLTPKFEGIPFLTNFPKLDGVLTDWGRIRPLLLRNPQTERGPKEPILLYAAWNYQGFFFGYRVTHPADRFCYPAVPNGQAQPDAFGVTSQPPFKYGTRAWQWAINGDHFRILLDTLDSRGETRGDPHTQEFVILPRGTESNPELPGIERYFECKRDGVTYADPHHWEGFKACCRIFPNQPQLELGPDGTGPYRVTRFENDGYTTEVFLPRTVLKIPVFSPGWYVGVGAMVGLGLQHSGDWRGYMFIGQSWGHLRMNADRPSTWGDLLLLGTDARVVVQDADESGTVTQGVIPGHSYLLTVVDPDRNVNPSNEDTVLVSAEVLGGKNDVEVFLLKETGKNTSTFRGWINTQPGAGRQVQGVVECMAGDTLRLGYVDTANARGERNVVTEVRLPVVSGILKASARR